MSLSEQFKVSGLSAETLRNLHEASEHVGTQSSNALATQILTIVAKVRPEKLLLFLGSVPESYLRKPVPISPKTGAEKVRKRKGADREG